VHAIANPVKQLRDRNQADIAVQSVKVLFNLTFPAKVRSISEDLLMVEAFLRPLSPRSQHVVLQQNRTPRSFEAIILERLIRGHGLLISHQASQREIC